MTQPHHLGVLSHEANERTFREQIVPKFLTGPPAQERPVLVIVGGQTGAGKTAATTMVKRALGAAGGFVNIDMDLYNPEHPAWVSWQAADPVSASVLVRPDGESWWVKAQDYAMENRMHVVLESAMRYPSEFEDVARRFLDEGYRVEVALVAVPESVSRLGILERYWEGVRDSGRGRLVDPEIHGETYRGVLRGAGAVDAGGLVHFACALRRDGAGVYINQVDTVGAWQRPPGLAQAVDQERSRTWTVPEARSFLTAVRRLSRELDPTWHQTLQTIQALGEPHFPAGIHAIVLASEGAARSATEAPQQGKGSHEPDISYTTRPQERDPELER